MRHDHGCDAISEFALGRLIVTVEPHTAPEHIEKIARTFAARAESLGEVHWLFHFSDNRPLDAVIPLLLEDPRIHFVELDRVVQASMSPNDPGVAKQWYLDACTIPPAWDQTTGVGVSVGIIDTGVSYTHPDLVVDQGRSWDYYLGGPNASDDWGHGTMVAGCVGMTINNALGGAGVAPGVTIVSLKVTDSQGVGYWSKITAAINGAWGKGIRVLNASFENMLNASSILSAASIHKGKGGLVFVAGGNTGNDPGHTPTTAVVAVVGTNSSDGRWSGSSYGPWASLAAPAVSIYTTLKSGGYTATAQGTSFASPIAAAAAALVMAASKLLTGAQVENILFSTADPLAALGMGHGIVNAAKAVNHALEFNPNPPDEETPPPIDVVAPSVAITSPPDGTVSGSVKVSMTSDEYADLEILIDGKLKASGSGRLLSTTWNTRKEAKGNHTILCRATDDANPPNVGQAQKTVTK